MWEVSENNSENYETMEQIIEECGLSGTDVLQLLTDWHGLDLVASDFMENLIENEL